MCIRDRPYVMFGHSMGSFLTRTYIIKHPDKYDAVILSGTGHQTKPLVLGGYAAAAAAVKFCGPRKEGDKLNDLAFGAYTKGIDDPRTPFDWLSRDPAVADAFMADEACGFMFGAGAYATLTDLAHRANDPATYREMCIRDRSSGC